MAITYYSELKNAIDIINPLIDNNVYMRYIGGFDSEWNENEIEFDNFGYGLKRPKHGKGIIFSDDASKLLSMSSGYVSLLLQLPENIENGVYAPVKNTNHSFLLFGINIGNTTGYKPTIYASLTKDGIKFNIDSSVCAFEMHDTSSNIDKDNNVLLEWMWKSNGIDDFNQEETLITVNYRVNGENVIIGNPPLVNDSISGGNFCILNTPYRNNNFECIIKKIIVGNSPPISIEDELFSSSSEEE